MTPEEAIRSLESTGPGGGDWRPWRANRAAAVALVEAMPHQALMPWQERLRVVCTSPRDAEASRAAALVLLRQAGEDVTVALSLLQAVRNKAVVLQALERMAALGDAVWAVVEPLASGNALNDAQAVKLLCEVVPLDEHGAARFSQLAAHAPMVAARWARELGIWRRKDLRPFAAHVVALAGHRDAAVKECALAALAMSSWRHTLGPPVELLRQRLPGASDQEAGVLARILALEHLRTNTAGVETLLRDNRPDVRLGAVEALAHLAADEPECWTRMLRAGDDTDARVREHVFTTGRTLLGRGKRLDQEHARALASALDGPAGAAVAVFLAFVARFQLGLVNAALPDAGQSEHAAALNRTLAANGTRACHRCWMVPRQARWDHFSNEPKGYGDLERVPGGGGDGPSLLRCPACQAHFSADSSSEMDVNSRHDAWWYRRLTLRELREHHAARVDLSHPRVVTWEADLQADLEHVDPAVRAEAAWELHTPAS